jgi:hypothetical protein
MHACAGAAAAWGRLERGALEACVCSIALALAAIMAGSGHLPTLRLLRGALPALSTTPSPFLISSRYRVH